MAYKERHCALKCYFPIVFSWKLSFFFLPDNKMILTLLDLTILVHNVVLSCHLCPSTCFFFLWMLNSLSPSLSGLCWFGFSPKAKLIRQTLKYWCQNPSLFSMRCSVGGCTHTNTNRFQWWSPQGWQWIKNITLALAHMGLKSFLSSVSDSSLTSSHPSNRTDFVACGW